MSYTLDHAHASSKPLATPLTSSASSRELANTLMQSRLAQAGTTPLVDHAPSEGL